MEKDHTRRYVLASFWAVVLLLGLPLWHYTTLTPRSQLPLEEMVRPVCPTMQDHAIEIYSANYTLLKDLSPPFPVRWVQTPTMESYEVRLHSGEQGYEVSHRTLTVSIPQTDVSFVCTVLEELFAPERDRIEHLLDGRGSDQRAEMRGVVGYSTRYELVFSLLNGDAQVQSWDIEDAFSMLHPLLSKLDGISKFSVDSQVQLLSHLAVAPQWTSEGHYTLSREQLASFVNSAEWNLASLEATPTLHFIVYVPSDSPLLINSPHNAFLIPQWGGVHILNTNTTHLSAEELSLSFKIFASYLLDLLGATHTASLMLRIDGLQRQRCVETMLLASNTLAALARVVQRIPQIPIPAAVAESTHMALRALEHACAALQESKFSSALAHARLAREHSERAFFDKAMVAQVYFPDEHKAAVYLPLLGPVAMPLVLALYREIRSRL